MLFPISLLQNRLNVETICGNISLVGVGALDDPSLCDAYSSGQRKIITCMWSGITTYRSIFTPGMFSLDNQYFSVILPISVHCICGVNGSSKAPTPTGLIISESILFVVISPCRGSARSTARWESRREHRAWRARSR